MKKNFSQSFLKPTPYQQSSIKNSSIQKPTPSQQPIRRPFTRKPGGACLPLSRKRGQQPATQIDTTMQLTNISQILQKTKNVKFISCRSQASLNGSVISKSNGSLSFANSVNDEINQIGQFSRILPSDSISPEKQNAQREIFRRKSGINIRTPIVTKKKYDESQNFSMMTCKARNIDNAQQQTKLQSSQFSDLSKSYCAPQSILTKNLVHSKNSSKDSMRKSNSSNSLIKKDPSKQCQQCQECQLSQRQIKDLNVKLERLQRIVKNKDQQIGVLNKKLQQNEKKIREMDRKIKDIEKQDFVSKVQMLEEQLNDSQEECTRIKEAYTKTMQQLKYKNVQNQTFKKYQAQCQALERKMQLLVSERNELRQRLSSARLSSKQKSNSYTNYPSTLARQSKGPHNLVVNHSKNLNSQSMRQTLTSRNQECGQFQDDFPNQNDQSFLTVNDGWKKKSRNVGRCYEDSSDTEIISLSEQSNF